MHEEPHPPAPDYLLVIGYGNTLRRDDGVGARVAASVAELNLKGVRAIVCHQLTPELAEPIAKAEHVVFVDAAADSSGSVQLRDVELADTPQIMTHAVNPQSLLALARQVFGRCPSASWLRIPVRDFGFGDQLSPLAIEGVQIAIERLRTMAAHRSG